MKFLLFKKHEQSECIIAFEFFKLIYVLTKKIVPRIERKRDSIEFERSENQGQFFLIDVFNVFNSFFNVFSLP